jgi:hypothetical protein
MLRLARVYVGMHVALAGQRGTSPGVKKNMPRRNVKYRGKHDEEESSTQ